MVNTSNQSSLTPLITNVMETTGCVGNELVGKIIKESFLEDKLIEKAGGKNGKTFVEKFKKPFNQVVRSFNIGHCIGEGINNIDTRWPDRL